MRHPLACLLLPLALVPASLAAAETEPASWGKVGVSIEQYRQDAAECGRAGYYLDVSHTDAARVFKQASAQLDANENAMHSLAADPLNAAQVAGQSQHIVEATRPEQRFAEVRKLQQDAMTRCLKERGYRQFRLTKAQQAQLRGLKLGSVERRSYLYRLAIDPQVLAGQAL